jgi:peptide/nickel transport system permease protein
VTTFQRYLTKRAGWYFLALVVTVVLNWYLPRLIPGNPVDVLIGQMAGGSASGEQVRQIRATYFNEFGLNHPLWEQFLIYVGNLLHGNMGKSFSLYPANVSSLIGQTLPWTLGLQLPAILVGWILGNVLGALAAYKGGWLDRGAFLGSLFVSSMPYYCLAILLVYGLAVATHIFPAAGGYAFGNEPDFSSPSFILDVLRHYALPFFSIVIVFIGGQAIGMRSMSIYELGSDYVNYSRSLGVGDNRIIRYIFRNASLPQITGLALSIASVVSGGLITEIVFSYPGIGTLLFSAIRSNDYPVISGITLVIAIGVLLANFLVEIAYGLIDPRIRAAQAGER